MQNIVGQHVHTFFFIETEKKYGTVNPHYNDSISSQRRCHKNEFAVQCTD